MLTTTDKPGISRTKLTAWITALFGAYELFAPLFDLPILTAQQSQPVILVLVGLLAHFMRSGIALQSENDSNRNVMQVSRYKRTRDLLINRLQNR